MGFSRLVDARNRRHAPSLNTRSGNFVVELRACLNYVVSRSEPHIRPICRHASATQIICAIHK
jgi:hypothetical protein